MKLHLTFSEKEKVDGFIQFSHSKQPIDNLDQFIDNGELEEILVDHCLCKFPLDKFDVMVDNWADKLSMEGVLTVLETDSRLLCKTYIKDMINLIEFNEFLMSNKAAITLLELEKMLKSKGFKTLEKTIYNNFLFKLKVEKLGN